MDFPVAVGYELSDVGGDLVLRFSGLSCEEVLALVKTFVRGEAWPDGVGGVDRYG